MFQFPPFAFKDLCIQSKNNHYLVGFPHSEIPGSKFISNSPRLIAGNHVLLRFTLPSHPPYALINLNKLRVYRIDLNKIGSTQILIT